jgi:hypothetical protein
VSPKTTLWTIGPWLILAALLMPPVVHADEHASSAETRTSSRRSGKVRAAVGFGIFGAAGLTSALLWSTAFSRSGDGYEVNGDRVLLAYVAAVSAAVGAGVGISGVVVMLREGQPERESAQHFNQPSRLHAGTAPLGLSVHLPLLSLTF